jgi:hypothetical protein
MIDLLFQKLNQNVFNGELKDVSVELDDLTDTEVVGCYDPDVGIITISTELTNDQVQGVLLHEMVHAWDYAQRGTTNHGRNFNKKASEIKRIHRLNVL